ncbi:MAG: stage IV sporulation protein A [Lachnospiraceae bacterium]|nr:stage IV sporulation protein A [Lachnospiraceae bacterium]
MTNQLIYDDIARRTGGDIYIGVVGPVRTGKSTFIKRFMEELVLPNMAEGSGRDRARDEMPQAAGGKTVMTTEPKFIPEEAAKVVLGSGGEMRVRMVDCVGFMIPEALGASGEDGPRMVHTPWSKEPIPFGEAAEIGTRKVISEHSTIGILMTTDGTIGEIPRSSYEAAEKKTAAELKAMRKPFAVVLNSKDPGRPESIALAEKLETEYGAPVALVNCLELNGEDISSILEMILMQFPVTEIGVNFPRWTDAVPDTHPLKKSLREDLMKCAASVGRVGNVKEAFSSLSENENVSSVRLSRLDLGTGEATVDCELKDDLYYRVVSEMTGFEIASDASLISLLREYAEKKSRLDRLSEALDEVERNGYGIVTPEEKELKLEEPEIIRHAGAYGVRLKASGPSIHLIRADIETEISPVVGTEAQSEELVRYLLHEFDEDPAKLWESNIFGKSLHDLITEGLHTKLAHMPAEARARLSETLTKVINEGSGGLICIIL